MLLGIAAKRHPCSLVVPRSSKRGPAQRARFEKEESGESFRYSRSRGYLTFTRTTTPCTLKTEQRGQARHALLSLRFIEPMKVKPSGY